MEWKRQGVVGWLRDAAADLQEQSMDDLNFGKEMPRGYVTDQKVDKTVWSIDFFDGVDAELNSPIGIQKLVWKWNPYSPGALIIASRRVRQEILDDVAWATQYEGLAGKPAQQLAMLKRAMFDATVVRDGHGNEVGNEPSFLKQYQSIVRKPEEAISRMELGFQDYMDWQKSFHIMETITDPVYIQGLVARLRSSRLVLDEEAVKLLFATENTAAAPAPAPIQVVAMVPTAAPPPAAKSKREGKQPLLPIVATATVEPPPPPALAQPTKHFYMCSCRDFRHYAWCIHSMLKAVTDGLVAKPYRPPKMVTKKPSYLGAAKRKAEVGQTLGVGRPAKAAKRGALTKG